MLGTAELESVCVIARKYKVLRISHGGTTIDFMPEFEEPGRADVRVPKGVKTPESHPDEPDEWQ